MKKTLFLLTFALVLGQMSAQSKIYSTTHFSSNSPKNSRTEYVHTYGDGIETIVGWLYTRPDSAPNWVSSQTRRFDAQKRLLTNEFINTSKAAKTNIIKRYKYFIENTYNNGCLVRQQRSRFENDVLVQQYTIDSKNNARCQVVEDRLTAGFRISGSTQFQNYLQSVKTYTYDARDSITYIRYVYGSDSGYLSINRRLSDGKEEVIESNNVCDFCIDVLPVHTKKQIRQIADSMTNRDSATPS